jgi:hypothetical protein
MSSIQNSPVPTTKLAYDGVADPKIQAAVNRASQQLADKKNTGSGDHPKGRYPSVGR